MIRRLEFTVCLSGAVVMALELTAARIFAPFLGSSIYTWTSLIGVILACLSIGYYFGGRWADKRPEFHLLGFILLFTSSFLAIASIVEFPILNAFTLSNMDIRLKALLASVILFSIPSVCLGMVLPFVVRLSLKDIDKTGSVVGRLYALSTIGSILGTFITGYYAFAYLGSSALVLILALICAVLSMFIAPKSSLALKLVLCVLIILLMVFQNEFQKQLHKSGLVAIDTEYHRAFILDTKSDGRDKRTLITDPLGAQSSMYKESPEELSGRYMKFYNLAMKLDRNSTASSTETLMLGGGAYSYPKYFLNNYPDATMDVVEIDPGMTQIARKYFSLKDSSRLNIYHQDARTYLRQTNKSYDVIFVDVFRSSPSLPFHLVTNEFVELLKQKTKENGLVVINVIAGVKGPTSQILRAIYKTYKHSFPQVFVFPVDFLDTEKIHRAQNVVLIAVKSSKPPALVDNDSELTQLFNSRWQEKLTSNVAFLTDDFAPVEQYMLPVFTSLQNKTVEKKARR